MIWFCVFANPNFVTRLDEYALCAPMRPFQAAHHGHGDENGDDGSFMTRACQMDCTGPTGGLHALTKELCNCVDAMFMLSFVCLDVRSND